MINDDLVKIKNVSVKIKKKKILSDINLVIKKNTIHGLIGPNGSGKTTLIKTIINAIKPSEGTITINGKSNLKAKTISKVGYIPEKPVFPEHLTAFQFLSFMGQLRHLSVKQANKKAENLLKVFQLEKNANENPNYFSSGMKSKLMLAQAVMHNPEILILDEPTSNLDPDVRFEVLSLLKNLTSQNKTIIICSHILLELDQIIDELTIIHNGKVDYNGPCLYKSNDWWIIDSDKQSHLMSWLKQNKYDYFLIKEYLIVKIDDKINFKRNCQSNNIKILSLKPYNSNLQDFYLQFTNSTFEISKINFNKI